MRETPERQEMLLMQKFSVQTDNPQERLSSILTKYKRAGGIYADIGWAAGFLDADGNIGGSIRKQKSRGGKNIYCPRIGYSNCNPAQIQSIKDVLDACYIPSFIKTQKKNRSPKHRTKYYISIDGFKRCDRFLRVFTPYLRGKKPQAILLSEICKRRIQNRYKQIDMTEFEQQCWDTIRMLNERGADRMLRDFTPDASLTEAEDIVRACMKMQESGRNDQARKSE